MKRILSLSVVLLVSLLCVPAATETYELKPENTVILSNETDESFCRDFSVLLKRLKPEWVILDTSEVPESVRERNLIIIGELDAEYTGDVIKEFLTPEEEEYIRDGHYSVREMESPWTENGVIYLCVGSDRVLTKKAAEEAVAMLMKNAKSTEKWGFPPVSNAPYEEAQKFLTQIQYIPGDDELPKDALQMEIDPKVPFRISREEASEDTEYLFYLFSHGYCGYGYFMTRGDFDEAKQTILGELETQPTWTPSDFSQILRDNLTFIHDCHLTIGTMEYGKHEDFWYDTTLEVSKTAGEYSFISDNTTHTVVSINGEDPDAFMFPSLNAQGDFMYRMGMLSQSAPDPLVLTVRSSNEQYQIAIELQRSTFSSFSDNIFREDTVGGIPVVRILSFSDHYDEYLNKFLQTARKYKGVPCLIIDIRGNRGGSETWPERWVTQFTGQKPSSIRYFTELISKTTMMGRANMMEYLFDKYPETHTYGAGISQFHAQADMFERRTAVPYWTGPFSSSAHMIPNETTLIVVMNGRVASSGEGFVNYLSQVENVIFVGENTEGALVFGQMTYHRLPHSKLLVQLPTSLNIPLDLELREEKGLFPNLWIPAEDALNCAVAALRRGTITTVKPLPEEILQEGFVPEKPPLLEVKDLPLIVLIVCGIVSALVNRKRNKMLLFSFGGIWLSAGVILWGRESLLGAVFLILGTVYFITAVYKWTREKAAPELKE